MAQPSEETKKSATSMAFSRISKAALTSAKKTISTVGKLFTKKPENLVNESSPPVKIMGEIYKMMKLMDLDRKLNQEMVNAHIEEQNHLRDKRNKEIIKALTTPKIKKPRVTKPKKTKVEEPEIPLVEGGAKAPTKPAVTPKTEAPATTPAPKTEAPTTTSKTTVSPKNETPVTTPKNTAPKTAEPAKEIAGPPKPTAAPAPKEVAGPPKPTAAPDVTAPITPAATAPVASTAVKAGVGVAIAGASSMSFGNEIGNKIASHESAGNSAESYNQMNNATNKKLGRIDNDWNKHKLTDMTIGEVLQLAEQRRKQFNIPEKNGKLGSIGVAAGKYQFVPATLKDMATQVFGKDYKNIPFSPETQERLHDRLLKREINGLKRFNVPVSEATIYMAHFVGPEVAGKIYNAPDNVKIGTLMDADQKKSNPAIADLTVGEYKARISTNTKSKQALSFQELDRRKLEEFLQTAQNQKGNKLIVGSVEGQDLKKDMNAQLEKMQTQQNINVLAQAQQQEPKVINTTKPNDSNPLLEKVRAG